MIPSTAVQKNAYKKQAQSSVRFSMLKDIRPEYQWGGHLTLSLNNVDAFDEV